jgi:hypothetical protein
MFRRALSGLLSMAAVMALAAANATEASAGAYGCSGSLVGKWRVPLEDQLTGETYYRSDIRLYYNSRSGWNCAVLAKRPGQARYGERTPLYIEMYNARWAEDNWKNNYDDDEGRFKYYAGPVRVYGRNLCVSIIARHGDHTGGGDPDYNGRRWVSGVACD